MNKVRLILENPPTKKIKCNTCGGVGYINPRGMITSDNCPDCHEETGFHGGTNTGKMTVPDYKKTEQLIRKVIDHEEKAQSRE